MEYIRIRQINGAGNCYDIHEYQAENKATLEDKHKEKNKYHDSMPGNGYAGLTWITPEYNRLRLIAGLVQDRLNKEIKITFQRDNEHGGYGRLIPVSKLQKEKAKILDIDWETIKRYIYDQVQDRIWGTVLLDGVIIYGSSDENPELGPEFRDLIDLLTWTRIQINEIKDYKLIK